LEKEAQATAGLSDMLMHTSEDVKQLQSTLDTEIQYSQQLYQALRVERQGRQRATARKLVLEQQIILMKATDLEKSSELKQATNSASKAVKSLETQNSHLRSQLSKALEQCSHEAVQSQHKLKLTGLKLGELRKNVSYLQKRCNQAATVQRNAVHRERAKAEKKHAVHSLTHKGIYTEKTRNLIHLLVKAGCSRNYIGQVISAVFKTAGISVQSSISRRTVSRIVLEGYYAALLQLGYEMKGAKSQYFDFFNF
jgi:small-conductance mechanosensitive channel